MACETKAKIGFLGSAYFIGWACTLLILPRIADNYGRKYVYRITMTIFAGLLAAVYASKTIESMIVIIFLIGACTSIRISVCFVYMLEFV